VRRKHIPLAVLIVLTISVLSASAQDTRKVVSKPAPAYPDIARRISLTGTVKLQIVIGKDGRVKDVNVIGGHPILINAAVDAVKNWKYEPGPSESTTNVQFDFK
jgi:TonB family protein